MTTWWSERPDGAGSSVLELDRVRRTYDDAGLVGLREASLQIAPGEKVAVIGPSGSGKSTLLNVVGLLDRPQAGIVRLNGRDIAGRDVSEGERDQARRTELGFVFQSFHVLGTRSARQNLQLRLAAARVPRREWATHTERALAMVGLADRSESVVADFSGGEKQRLAVARALVPPPSLILADEPTGNLDHANTSRVLGLLDEATSGDVAALVITHEDTVAAWADRVMRIENGVLR